MARPNTLRGTKLLLLLGNGATPEVFTQFCGITAKSINFQKNTGENFVPDCDNPDDPPWRELFASGLFVDITGEGIMDSVVKDRMFTAWKDSDPLNARLELNVSAALGGGYWNGAFQVTNLTFTGNNEEGLATASISLGSSGEVTWVPAT